VQKVTARFFDWKIMLLAAAPLIFLTLGGQGYLSNIDNLPNQNAGVGVGLSNQYLIIALVLASFGIVTRFGRRALLPVVLAQSALMAAVGERAGIVITTVLLLYALGRFGVHMRRTQVIAGALVAVFLTLVITSARAAEGRFVATSADSLRFGFLVAGVVNIGSPSAMRQLSADLGYRFDGNSFGSMELQALDRGAPTLGTAPLTNDVLLAIPSFLNPAKDSTDLGQRVEKVYAEEHLGLTYLEVAPGVWTDILPTQIGGTLGYWGPLGMLAAGAFLGFVIGLSDRWLLRGMGPARLLIGLGLLSCVLSYDSSLDIYTTSFRGILLLLAVLWLLKGGRRSLKRAGSRLRVPSRVPLAHARQRHPARVHPAGDAEAERESRKISSDRRRRVLPDARRRGRG
jgi:hypothetical protein